MATKSRVGSFRTIDSHSVAGGGPEPLELIRLPTYVWLTWFVIRFPFRHRIFGLVLLAAFMSLILRTNFLLILLVSTLIAVVALYLYTWTQYLYIPTLPRLTQAIRRRWIVHSRWPRALRAANFNSQRRLSNVKYTPNGILGSFLCDQGKDSEDLKAQSFKIASALKANEVKIDALKPFEAQVSILWGDPTDRILFPEDLSQCQPHQEDRIAFSLDDNSQPLELSITTSILIVGEPESGKSNCFWSILNALNEKEIPYKMWVVDPAGGVELNELEHSPNTIMYAQKPSETAQVFENAEAALNIRLNNIQGNGRKNVISKESPLNIIVIDEMLLLPQNQSLTNIMSSGRKGSFIVIGLSQLSQVDAIGRIRDLFPQRICHATKSDDMTNAVLGTSAEQSGAYCSKISKRSPGVGYYYSLQTRLYTRFRTPLISDHNTRIIAQGNLIQQDISNQPIARRLVTRLGRRQTALYRYYGEYRNEHGRLLYVGIAYDPKKRWHEHCDDKTQPWCPHDIDTTLTEIEWYPSRQLAKAAETQAIKEEHPVYNKQERDDYARTA